MKDFDYKRYYQEPERKPYAIYIHGMGSGAASGTRSSLGRYLDEYEWIAPEITHDPYESLGILNEWAATFQPALIAGTSMGGLLTLYVNCPQAVKVAVNPTLHIEKALRRFGYGTHPYTCERENGETEFVIDETMVRRYIRFREETPAMPGARGIGVFASNDEVAGHENSLAAAATLRGYGYEIYWSDRFGHRLNERAAKQIAAWVRAKPES